MLHGFSCTFSFCSPTVTYFNHRSIPNAMPHFYPRFLHCDGYLCESLLQSGLGIGGRAAIQRPMLLSAPPSPWGPSHHHFFLGVISYKFFEIHLLDWGPKSRSSKVFTPNIVLTTVGPSAHGQKKATQQSPNWMTAPRFTATVGHLILLTFFFKSSYLEMASSSFS